jgi:hypothetical protein
LACTAHRRQLYRKNAGRNNRRHGKHRLYLDPNH